MRQRIVKAAKECFDMYGENRVSLEDVSRQAKVHRDSVYRLFKNREGLRKEVVFHCVEELVSVVSAAVGKCKTLEEAVMLGTLVSVEHCRADKTLNELLLSDPRLAQQELANHPEIEDYFARIWQPLFMRARKSGEIDKTWTYADFSQWLRGIQFIILVHEEMPSAAQKKLLAHFVRTCFTA